MKKAAGDDVDARTNCCVKVGFAAAVVIVWAAVILSISALFFFTNDSWLATASFETAKLDDSRCIFNVLLYPLAVLLCCLSDWLNLILELEKYQTFHSFHVELGAFNVYCKAREDFELGNHHYVSLQGCTWVLFTGPVYSHWIVKFCLPFWDSEFPKGTIWMENIQQNQLSRIPLYLPTCFKHHRSMVALRFSWEEMSEH